MSLTEKLSTIANNMSKVYDAGYEKGLAESSGGSGGGNNVFDYAKFLKDMFTSSTFPADYVMDIAGLTNLTGMANFCNNTTGLKTVILKADNSNSNNISMDYAFRKSSDLVSIDLSELGTDGLVKCQNLAHSFRDCPNLTSILGVLDVTDCISLSSTFDYSNSLVDVRFKEGSIKLSISFWSNKLLSDESIQSIIDGLADMTGSTALTITLSADVKNKLTEEQLTTITNKNWTIA